MEQEIGMGAWGRILLLLSIVPTLMSIGRPKDKKNNDSVSLQEALEPYYIHKVDGKD